jgi:hypothetical protein
VHDERDTKLLNFQVCDFPLPLSPEYGGHSGVFLSLSSPEPGKQNYHGAEQRFALLPNPAANHRLNNQSSDQSSRYRAESRQPRT